MAETQTTIAESSPAIEMQVAPQSAEAYAQWRQTGDVPEEQPKIEPKDEESATSDAPEQTAGGDEHDAPPAAPERKKGGEAQARIRELLAQNKELQRRLEERQVPERTDVKAEPSHAKAEPQAELKAPVEPEEPDENSYTDYEQYRADMKKYRADYRKFVEDLADYKATMKLREAEQTRQLAEQRKMVEVEIAKAQKRYANFDEIAKPTIETLIADQKIHPAVKEAIGRTDLFADLCYVIGGNKGEAQDFLELARTDPAAAIEKIGVLKHLIREELAKGTTPEGERDAKGRFTPNAPKKLTNAPDIPHEMSGHGSPPADQAEQAVKDGDFRAFFDAENRRDLERRRGR